MGTIPSVFLSVGVMTKRACGPQTKCDNDKECLSWSYNQADERCLTPSTGMKYDTAYTYYEKSKAKVMKDYRLKTANERKAKKNAQKSSKPLEIDAAQPASKSSGIAAAAAKDMDAAKGKDAQVQVAQAKYDEAQKQVEQASDSASKKLAQDKQAKTADELAKAKESKVAADN